VARTVLRIRPWRVQRTAPRFLSALGCAGGGGHEPPGCIPSLARLQDRAALVHLAASSALGCAGGIIHESLGHPFPWRVYRTRLAATLMRGVAVSHPRSSRFFCYLPHRFVYRTGRPTTIQPRAAGGESHPKTPRRSRGGNAVCTEHFF
jgi:hypothetical protein